MRNPPDPSHLSPHLREVCAIMAVGLVRLCGHTKAGPAEDAPRLGAKAKNSLHFLAHQSGYANPNRRRVA
jgi:hypothetical protein